MKIKLDDKTTAGIILVLIALFSLTFLGFIGFKVIFGMLLVFFLPFYLILNNFNLSRSEKTIFALFIGLGIFPALVYWLGTLVSFKLAIIISFIFFISLSFMIKKFSSGKQKDQPI